MNWERSFLGGHQASREAYRAAMEAALDAVSEHVIGQPKPFSGGAPREVARVIDQLEMLPETGRDTAAVVKELADAVLARAVIVSHPQCVAHLHCPPMIPALAAEALLTAANPSMDSWDQSGAATLIEQKSIDMLCQLYGYGEAADGTFTSGGTQSNFMGMQFARDWYAAEKLGWRIQMQGLPPEASKFRILCSGHGHFTIRQSAALLGLGENAVVKVATDEKYQMSLPALDETIARLKAEGLIPIAISATAGTTDYGSIDPLPELAQRAKEHGLWLHVDAAYGGALILSDRHKAKLAGIGLADSITVDFHKLFYQPISCGAFLMKDRANFDLIRLHASYLNTEHDEAEGVPNLVTKSIQTTRRFDALKLVATLQAQGRQGLAAMIDQTIDLAADAARLIEADPELELRNHPQINALVFRYRPAGSVSREAANEINRLIRLGLLESGQAVIAHTEVGGLTHLKLTLLNPLTTIEHVQTILGHVKRLGRELEKAE